MPDKISITLDVNGREHRVSVEPRRTLVDVLRDDCHLTGTHIGCEHGVCGACTILVDDKPIRSCLMFGVQAEGRKIRTVEGPPMATHCIRCRRRSGKITVCSAGSAPPGF